MPANSSAIASPAAASPAPRCTSRPATIAASSSSPVTVVCQVPGTPRMRHVVEDHHQDQRADHHLRDPDATRRQPAGAERHDGDGEELQALPDRGADQAGARRHQDRRRRRPARRRRHRRRRGAARTRRPASRAATGASPTACQRAAEHRARSDEPDERGQRQRHQRVERHAQDRAAREAGEERPADLDPGIVVAERHQAQPAHRDHRAERDDDRADPQPLDQRGVEQPDRGADADAGEHRQRRRQPLGQHDAGERRGGEHHRADREVDAADQHHQSPSPRPSTSTEADWRRMFAALPGVPKTGEVSGEDQRSRITAATSIGFRASTPSRESQRQRAARPRWRAPASCRGRSLDHQVQPLLVDRRRASSRRRSRRRADQDAVGQRQHLRQVARDDDDRLAGARQRVEPAVDLGPRARRRRRASARSGRRRRRRPDASARAAPSAGCRPTASASAPRPRRRRRRTRPSPARRRAAPPRRSTSAERPAPVAERGHRDVLAQRQVRQDALGLALLGEERRSPPRPRRAARRARSGRPSRTHAARLGAQVAAEHARDLVLPGAEEPGQRQRSRRAATLERHAAHARCRAEALAPPARPRPASRAGRDVALGLRRRPSPRSAAPRSSRRGSVVDHLAAVAQHRDQVAERQHLAEAVRDVEDRHALRLQPADRREELLAPRAARATPSARRGSGAAGPTATALAISTICRSASDSRPTGVSGAMSSPSRPSASRARAAIAATVEQARPRAARGPARGSRPPSGCGSRLSSW